MLLCYGVENAVSVRLEPPVEQLEPRYNRCFQVTPLHTTTYRLVAEGNGTVVSETVTVQVRAAPQPAVTPEEVPSLITLFLASATETSAGRPVTLCYGAPEAASVSLSPAVRDLAPTDRTCFSVSPAQTTTYTLTARAPGGPESSESLTVQVR